MIITVTGHRPNKLGGYNNLSQLEKFAENKLSDINSTVGPITVLTGMALGWDQAVAKACIKLNIPFIAYIPCMNQENLWSNKLKLEYYNILEQAKDVILVSDKDYTPECMKERNKRMVNDANIVLALWDGSSGGTCHCVTYASSVNRTVVNLWKHWDKYNG